MITYPLLQTDLELVKTLHDKYYAPNFPLPDFSRTITNFKIVDDKFNPILVGGVRYNAELIVMTDKEKSANERAFALVSALQIGSLAAAHNGHNLLYATAINDNKWLEQLRSYGFRDSIGTHLVIG